MTEAQIIYQHLAAHAAQLARPRPAPQRPGRVAMTPAQKLAIDRRFQHTMSMTARVLYGPSGGAK
jgi:hypothetical protein